jgi:miniconductance mechanosensitive channel
MMEFIKTVVEYFNNSLLNIGFSSYWASHISQFTAVIILFIFSYLAYYVTWKVIRKLLLPIFQRSKNKFDDLLVKHEFFRRIAYLVPAILLYHLSDKSLDIFPDYVGTFNSIIEIFFVVIAVLITDSMLSTLNDFYDRYDFAKDHPIKGLVQITKIIIYVIAGLIIIGNLVNKDLSSLIIGMGTISAVLMLIFKDPILGFVGGLQLIFNKMLSIGDWITMSKFGADGIVLEINLTTVKVQNWDKTIVTIPTYSLISDSFQNWRGMEEAGGRRIKRAVYIDMDSIAFCTEEMLEKFKKIVVLKPYLEAKEKELKAYNKKFNTDPESVVNGRRQTNIGVFRAYLKAYLKNRQDIHNNMTFLVRQLPLSEKGLPIEIYVFTKTTDWAEYEDIQADIFDHILAVVPEFNLRVYEFPSNSGIKELIKTPQT